MIDYKLTEIYNAYLNSSNLMKEAYGTLYKKYGGKKDIPEESSEMRWYIGSLERLNRAYPKFRDRLIEYENKVKNENDSEVRFKEYSEFTDWVSDFYIKRFKSCLDMLLYYFTVKIGVKEEKKMYLAYWVTAPSGNPLINSGVTLLEKYVIGEMHKELGKIFIELKGNQTGVYYRDYDISQVMNEISFILNHTSLVFKK